jgi:hypothetical protein
MENKITIFFKYSEKRFGRETPETYEEIVDSFHDFTQCHKNDTQRPVHLTIIGKKFEKIEYTDLLNELTSLQIQNTSLKKIDGLDYFEKLRKISISYSQLDEIPNLDKFKIHDVVLVSNRISKIENLNNKLVWLNLAWNQITKIENLSDANPTYLDLSGNQISKIENLNCSNGIGELDLSKNRIFKLENLEKTSYSKIILYHNKICSTKGVRLNKELEMINLSNNPILDFSFENVEDVEINLNNTFVYKLNLHLMKDIVGFNQYTCSLIYVVSDNYKTSFKETLI